MSGSSKCVNAKSGKLCWPSHPVCGGACSNQGKTQETRRNYAAACCRYYSPYRHHSVATLHWPTQPRAISYGNQRCDIGDLGYSLFMGGNWPLFRRKPKVFRFLNLVSGKDNECKVPVPASSQTKSLEIRLLIIQNIESWMEPTVFTSPRRFRLRKTPQPSPAQHSASCSRNYLFVAVFPPSCCDQLINAIRTKHSAIRWRIWTYRCPQ